jgi:hypothetical protein
MKEEITLIAVLTLASLGSQTSAIAQTVAPVQVSPAAAATEEIGHNAENLYDWGRQKNWTKARADLTALKSAVAKLKTTGEVTNLQGTDRGVVAIEAAVQRRRPRALMHSANEMTSVAAELSRQFKPQVPVEVTLLDYDGRELELWAEEGNLVQLREARTRLQEVWTAVRPAVVSKGGTSEARQFDALVNQLIVAKTPKDFAAVATPILNSVDSLENVFKRGSV